MKTQEVLTTSLLKRVSYKMEITPSKLDKFANRYLQNTMTAKFPNSRQADLSIGLSLQKLIYRTLKMH
jgi:hypothetical protein